MRQKATRLAYRFEEAAHDDNPAASREPNNETQTFGELRIDEA